MEAIKNISHFILRLNLCKFHRARPKLNVQNLNCVNTREEEDDDDGDEEEEEEVRNLLPYI